MKKSGLFFVGLLLSVFCLTSCLEGSNVSEGYGLGVLGLNNNLTPILKTPVCSFASANLNSLLNAGTMQLDNCYYFYYQINFDLPENGDKFVESNGFYTITLLEFAELSKYYLSSSLTDNTTALPDEKPVLKGFINSNYVEGYLFIEQTVYQPSDMELWWDLSYDYNTMMPTVEGNNRYYDLYIRAIMEKEGTKDLVEMSYLNAYYMGNYLRNAANNEKTYLGINYSETSSQFKVRFNYVTSINENTGELIWESEQIEVDIAPLL